MKRLQALRGCSRPSALNARVGPYSPRCAPPRLQLDVRLAFEAMLPRGVATAGPSGYSREIWEKYLFLTLGLDGSAPARDIAVVTLSSSADQADAFMGSDSYDSDPFRAFCFLPLRAGFSRRA